MATTSRTVPPGWTENPTAWPKRLRLIALATAGLLVASYLTLYQVGVFDSVFDPIFPHGTPKVLDFTHPVPDAAFGALAYAAEIVLSLIGGEDRWRTQPWTALGFGAVVTAGAVTSVALIIIQPVAVGAWCSLCLLSAAISLALFALGIDEAVAAAQEVARARRGGASWRRAVRGPVRP
jgi:hypothetical protein